MRADVSAPRTDREIVVIASRALGRIDRDGPRALTGLSVDEIEAMAITLVMVGLVATPPGQPDPATLFITKQEL